MLFNLILLEKKILTSKDNYFMNNVLLLGNYRELKDLLNSLSVVDLLIGKNAYLTSRKFI